MDDISTAAPAGRPSRDPALRRRHPWPAIAAAADGASNRLVAAVGSPLPLLLTLSLVQALLWLWATFGIAQHRIASAHALTLLGAGLYHPDHDLPIYLVGALCGVLLDAALVAVLATPALRTDTRAGPRTEFIACLAVALLPFVAPDDGPVFLVAGAMGLGVFAWRLRRRWRSPPPAAPTAAVAARAGAPRGALPRRRLALLPACAIPVAVLALLVFVPWPQALVWQSYGSDRFHHADFYAMAPALAHAHGQRLGTDFYSQYGVGWPLLMDGLHRVGGAWGYTTFVRLELLVGCAYFLGLFVFLRSWLRSTGTATAGMLLALVLALLTDTSGAPKWLWPSSTVLRYAFDIALFAVLLVHARTRDARLGPLAGAVLALQLLFSSDVGLYLMSAFAVYLVCAARRAPQVGPAGSVGRFALGAVPALVLVAGAGFTLANQGGLPDGAFWRGLMESVVVYGDGIANLPIASAIGGNEYVALLLVAMLATYIRSTGAALSACFGRRVSARQSIRAAIAVYGMGTLMLFIGRSHEQNLLHVTIPFCLLVADLAASTACALRAGRPAPRIGLRHLLSMALVATIFLQAFAMGYPNAVDVALGAAPAAAARPTWTDHAGDALPIDPAARADEFRAATAAIRQASDGGRHTVAVIGYNDTAYLLEAGVGPYFRYSPVLANLLFVDQVKEVEQRLVAAPPDWIFIAVDQEHTLNRATTTDSARSILAVIEPAYVRQGNAGHFAVYRRATHSP